MALDDSKSLRQFNCRNWTRQSGLPVNSIRALAQTEDGYLWMATQKGLIKFDGNNFTILPLAEVVTWRNRTLIALETTRRGELWFGIESGTFGALDHTNGFRRPPKAEWVAPQLSVLSILEAKDGYLWLGTANGVARWNPASNQPALWDTNVWNAQVLHEDSSGRIWIGTTDRGLFRWENGNLQPIDLKLNGESIFALTTDSSGNLWVGTQWGLRCFDAQLNPRPEFQHFTEVRVLYTDRVGGVWIGTSGNGIQRYYRGTMETMTSTNGIANNYVTALLEDREGSMWIGTREGLSQLSDVKFPILTEADGILGSAAHGVAAGVDGGVWIASSRGVSWHHGTTNKHFTVESGLRVAYTKRVLQARNRDLYILNGNREIEVIAGDAIVARHTFENWPTAIAEDSAGVVVSVGTSLFRVNRQKIEPFTYNDGIAPQFYWIRNVQSCADGSLLVSSVNGLFRLRDGDFEHWSTDQGFTDLDVLYALEDDEKTIWIGQMSGLSRLRNGRVIHIADDLVGTVVNAVMPDHRGNLWITSLRGIIRISRQSANDVADGRSQHLDGVLYDGLESVKTIDSTDAEFVACRTSDGRIWFPTPQGPVRIDPDHVPVNQIPPPVRIHSVLVNGIDVTEKGWSEVKAGGGELSFQFTAMSLLAPQKVRFRYILEGYDAAWVDAGTRRSALYANLKPRSYTFRVQACNADGLWNEAGASFAVTLPPQYYQTVWFRILLGVFGISALGGIYTFRVQHLHQKQRALRDANEALEQNIRERTSELSEQRNLLRTLIDHLPDEVFVKDSAGQVIINNLAHARNMGVEDPADAVGKTDFDCFPAVQAQQFRAAEEKLLKSGTEYDAVECVTLRSGQARWQRTTKVPVRDSSGQIIGLAGIHRDMTERKRWEAEMESLHKQLLQTSRQAGMAEVATSVLHNVGNVLNSVNVSASIVEDHVRNSGLERLQKVVELLQANSADLPRFLTTNDKGTKLIQYLDTLYKTFVKEKSRVQEEVQSLNSNIEHIKKIVSMQQSYARVAGLVELVKPSELLEDALRMHEAAFQRHSIQIVRDYEDIEPVPLDRHKAMQIIVNLLQNAKYACDVNEADNRFVQLRIQRDSGDRVRIEVIDNGMGIPPENLTRIFSYGFTTRKEGHGFGLHGGALAAREMGGSLMAYSDGEGKGARFVLELPGRPPATAPRMDMGSRTENSELVPELESSAMSA